MADEVEGGPHQNISMLSDKFFPPRDLSAKACFGAAKPARNF